MVNIDCLCVCGHLICNYISILFIIFQSNISKTLKKLILVNASRVLFFSCSWQQFHIFWENTKKIKLMDLIMIPAVHLSNFLYLFIRTHNHLVRKFTFVHLWTLNHLTKFRIRSYHLNFRYRACFAQGVPWHRGNCRV